MIRANCRERFTAADFEFVVRTLAHSQTDHVSLIDERFSLHQRRAEKLYRLIAEQPRTGHELAQALWGNVAVTQAFLTLSEVIGHVDLLVNAGHAREVMDGDIVRYEATFTDRCCL